MQIQKEKFLVYIITGNVADVSSELLRSASIVVKYDSENENFYYVKHSFSKILGASSPYGRYSLSCIAYGIKDYDVNKELRVQIDNPEYYITFAQKFFNIKEYKLAYLCLMEAYLQKNTKNSGEVLVGSPVLKKKLEETTLEVLTQQWATAMANNPKSVKNYFLTYWDKTYNNYGNTVTTENPLAWESNNFGSKTLLSWKEMSEEDSANYLPF